MCEKKPVKVFPTKVKKSPNTPAYYQCLLNASLQGFNGQRITDICRNYKLNGSELALVRQQQIQELRTNYQRIGEIINFLTLPLTHDSH